MQVGHHEVRIVQLQVERHGGDHHAGQAAEDEDEEEREREEHRRSQVEPPFPHRCDPAEDLQRGGDGDHHARRGEEALAEVRDVGREHVMHPQAEGKEGGRRQRQHDRRIAVDRPAREGRDDRRHECKPRDEDEVHLRVAEEVLPEERVAAFGRVVEMRADQAIEDQRRAGEHHRRHGEEDHERSHQHRPDEKRQARERHSGGAQLEDGRDDDDRGEQARELGKGDHLRPDVGALARGVFRAGERHVAEPAGVRPHVEQERDEQEQPTEEIDPIGERVHARKGDRAGTDHQRHQVDRHALHHRHGEEEHHRRAVRGEELVVAIRADQRALGPRELRSHERREDAGSEEEGERGDDVALANRLVVDGAERAEEPRRIAPRALEQRVHLSAPR